MAKRGAAKNDRVACFALTLCYRLIHSTPHLTQRGGVGHRRAVVREGVLPVSRLELHISFMATSAQPPPIADSSERSPTCKVLRYGLPAAAGER